MKFKKRLSAELRNLANKLDQAPYAESTDYGWVIHTPEGLPIASISTGREAR